VIGHPSIGSEQAERILLDYAGSVTGVDIAAAALADLLVRAT